MITNRWSLKHFTTLHLHTSRNLSYIAVSCLLLTLASCSVKSTKSVTTDVYNNPDNLVTINNLHYQWHQQSDGGLYRQNSSVTEYVEKVGNRIVKLSKAPSVSYEFSIIRNKIPHAIALLNGKLAINIGILFLIENEAELAALIAQNIACSQYLYHKLADPKLNLYIQNEYQLRQRFLNDFTYSSLDVEAELEFDKHALYSLIQGGYDPSAVLTLMEKLAKIAEEHSLHKGLFIHPYSRIRIERIKEQLQKCEKGGYLGESAYQNAMSPLKKAEPVYTLLQLGAGAVLEKKGQQALEIANKALLIDQSDPKAHILRGRALRLCNKITEAFKSFQTSIQLDPTYYEVYLERGKLYYQEDDYVNAIKDFEECLSKVPSTAAYYYMGKCYEKLGNKEKAIFFYKEIAHTNTVYGSSSTKILNTLTPTGL